MGTRVAVIADDLTSAADGAGPFRRAGLTARILLGAEAGLSARTDPDSRAERNTGSSLGTADVISIDLDSRRLTPVAAAAKTYAAVRSVRNVELLYKTIDSTLRGNLASEVMAALDASGRSTAIVAPAFPAEGRTTAGATQYVNGVPVNETMFANDISHPVTVADLGLVLPSARRWAPGEPLPDGVVIADAATDADLDEIVTAMPDLTRMLWVGSPGIAAALARHTSAPETSSRGVLPACRRVLVVVGSQSETSRGQLSAVVRPEHIADAGRPLAATVSELIGWLEEAGVAGLADFTGGIGPELAAIHLASTVAAVERRNGFDAVIATGGATVRAVLDQMGIETVELIDEPEPGIVSVLAQGHLAFPLIMKAGGFGDPDTFVRLRRLLATEPAERTLE